MNDTKPKIVEPYWSSVLVEQTSSSADFFRISFAALSDDRDSEVQYAVVNDISTYLDFADEEGTHGIKINFMAESGAFDQERLFYITSRGITKADAQRMMLPELRDPNFCYFTMAPELQNYFGEGFGMPYLLDVNHERRRRAIASKSQ